LIVFAGIVVARHRLDILLSTSGYVPAFAHLATVATI